MRGPKPDMLRGEEQLLEREVLPGGGGTPELALKAGSLARCMWWGGVRPGFGVR